MNEPAWWGELAEDLGNLGIVHVAVVDVGTPKRPAWRAVVYLTGDVLLAMAGSNTVEAVALTWRLAPRASEEAAWRAVEMLLRGISDARRRTIAAIPWVPGNTSKAAHDRGNETARRRWDDFRASVRQ